MRCMYTYPYELNFITEKSFQPLEKRSLYWNIGDKCVRLYLSIFDFYPYPYAIYTYVLFYILFTIIILYISTNNLHPVFFYI